MATSNEKLDSILKEIDNMPMHNGKDYYGKIFWFVLRRELKFAIIRALNLTDTHTINEWVNKLLAYGFISPNPHTELSAKQHKIKPSNDTRYIVNIQNIQQKLKTHTHTTLDSFNLSG